MERDCPCVTVFVLFYIQVNIFDGARGVFYVREITNNDIARFPPRFLLL